MVYQVIVFWYTVPWTYSVIYTSVTALCRIMQDTTPKICVYEQKDTYAYVRTYVSNK